MASTTGCPSSGDLVGARSGLTYDRVSKNSRRHKADNETQCVALSWCFLTVYTGVRHLNFSMCLAAFTAYFNIQSLARVGVNFNQ